MSWTKPLDIPPPPPVKARKEKLCTGRTGYLVEINGVIYESMTKAAEAKGVHRAVINRLIRDRRARFVERT